ncbi:general secretion pathway protein L [Marinobacter santoriniensis NKSG1]|uniref:Type II secretion system protein L n=1 Tax=Marinobacter santoriniensis NKSG1 TaxID=1288826 RepID=M7CX07_9GAMM|nr:type II secretion system protein GspL [Marinobacter santoriniensis]EMP56770.1 general secretion pathway protein L [Marinobacter santoriniensis NKSG1]
MSYRLFVRPVPPFADVAENAEAQLFQWALQDASGDIQARGTADTRDAIEQTLSQNALDNVLLIGLIPGEEALFCVADIPARQNRFIAQALPYAVEEQIAQDIDTVHLALGDHGDQGYRVAAIDRQAMANWVALFSHWHNARLEAVYPDASLLPSTEGGWSICLDGDGVMLISERGEWLAMQATNLGMFAGTLAVPSSEDVVAEVPVTLYGTEEELAFQQALVSDLRSQGRLAVKTETLEIRPLELLAHAYYHHLCRPINLCQGAFSNKAGRTSTLGPWKPLVAVAAIWFVVQVALEAGMGFYYQKQAEKLDEQAMAEYHKVFPNDTKTHAGNLRRVIEGRLRVAGSQGQELGFIALMKYTGEQYSRLPSSGSVTFNSVNFSRTRGELVVDLRADSYDRLSALRNGLSSQGLEAEIGSVVNESGGTRGRLTVSGG